MRRLLHVADSWLGTMPFGREDRHEDVWQGFSAAVDAAISLRADVLLHAGTVLTPFEPSDAALRRLRHELQRLAEAGVVPVLYQTGHDLLTLDVDCLLPGEPALEVCGLFIGTDATERLSHPSVLVAYGRVDGVGGLDGTLPTIDPQLLCTAPHDYVALGGANRLQPVQDNAWYSGQTAAIDPRDVHGAGGLLVDLGSSTGRILRLTAVSWADRPHHRCVVDGAGLDEAALADALRAAVEPVVAAAYEPPVLAISVSAPQVAMTATFARLGWVDGEGAVAAPAGALYAQVAWGGQRELLEAVASQG